MLFFFFKQKAAYEMRISDWSSDVCSSDLHHYGKIAAVWGLAFLIPFALQSGLGDAAHVVLEVALHEYLPFTILLLSLFTIAGGVRIVGNLHGDRKSVV